MLPMNFSQMEIADWGYDTSYFSPSEILDQLVEETRHAVDNWTLLLIDLERANDPAHSEFQRVSAEIPISAELFDAFFNGRTGYRAHYAASEEAGVRYNHAAADALAPILAALESRYAEGLDRSFCERSLAGPHTKLWFPKSISDPIAEPYLLTLAEEISVSTWRTWWAPKDKPRKGLLAPQSDAPTVLLNGTFLRLSDGAFWDQKPGRSKELHSRGWT